MASRALPEHLRVPWGIKDALIVFTLAWIGLPIVLVLFIRELAPYLPLAQDFLQGLIHGTIVASFTLVLIDAVAAMGLVRWYLRRHKTGWKAVGWRKVSVWRAALYLLAIFLIFIIGVDIILQLVSALVPSFNANQTQSNDFTSSTVSHPSLTLLALVIIPPIIEETVFRGFIFPAFAKKFGLIWGAVASSILFGFAHLQANVSIYTFILGLLLCFMYVKLKSIIPGIGLHMLNNYLAFIALSGK